MLSDIRILYMSLCLCRWLYSNKLKALPAEIGRMSQLRKLWLDSNQMTQLPEELGECTALQVLYSGADALVLLAA